MRSQGGTDIPYPCVALFKLCLVVPIQLRRDVFSKHGRVPTAWPSSPRWGGWPPAPPLERGREAGEGPRNGGMSESGSVRNTTLAPALGSPGTLGPIARVALWMPVGRGNVKFSMMGRKRGRFFSSAPFSAPLCGHGMTEYTGVQCCKRLV